MNISGITASHQIITDTCRTNRGDIGVINEVFDRIMAEYLETAKYHPIGKGVKFHVALLVETPEETDGDVQRP